MREIKFRIFDIDYDKMSEPFYIYHVGAWVNTHSDSVYLKEIDEKAELMQYTGLRDKNGIEIYEGDIVKVLGDNPVNKLIIRYDPQYTAFNLLPFLFLKGIISEGFQNQFEIIGNIYENPELLKN
jgi:hypothetical protein